MRHVIVGLLELVESGIYAVFDAQGVELDGVPEDVEDGDEFIPTVMIHILIDYLWHVFK